MKLTIRKPVEVEADAIRCVLNVRYEEEDMPNDYPHRKGDTWDVTIDLETGQIQDWPKGVEPLDIYMKVVDEGCYYLLSDGNQIAKREQEYVPDCIPGQYGDYVDFKIDSAGVITNWNPDEDEVQAFFFPSED